MPHTKLKMNCRLIEDLKLKHLEENMGANLHYFGLDNETVHRQDGKSTRNKRKQTDKLNFTKIKNFFSTNNTLGKV